MKNILLSMVLIITSIFSAMSSKKEKDVHITYAKILEIQQVLGYSYLKVDENGTERWVAIVKAPVKIGDKIGYDTKTVMKNFKSKSLNKQFDEIIFANEVYLLRRSHKAKSLKEALAIQPKTITEYKDFKEKPYYTVKELHKYRKVLVGKLVTIKAKVYKVSKQIMKRDWVHLGDGTGEESALNDDIVFTVTTTTVKAGDDVEAKGRVAIDKNFGYGYFYPVIVEEAHFQKVNH